MMKFNHQERSIMIAALKLAREVWNKQAATPEVPDQEEKTELRNNAVHARDLHTRFETEQS